MTKETIPIQDRLAYKHRVQEREDYWHRYLVDPYAVFVGEQPKKRYFYCTERHGKKVNCGSIKRSPLANALFQVAQNCGCPVFKSAPKCCNLLGFSYHFGLIDILDCPQEDGPAKCGSVAKRIADKIVAKRIADKIDHIASRCPPGRKLLVVSVLRKKPASRTVRIWEIVNKELKELEKNSRVCILEKPEESVWKRGKQARDWIQYVSEKVRELHRLSSTHPNVLEKDKFVRESQSRR